MYITCVLPSQFRENLHFVLIDRLKPCYYETNVGVLDATNVLFVDMLDLIGCCSCINTPRFSAQRAKCSSPPCGHVFSKHTRATVFHIQALRHYAPAKRKSRLFLKSRKRRHGNTEVNREESMQRYRRINWTKVWAAALCKAVMWCVAMAVSLVW